jgi:hypothetical protein
MTHTDSGDKSLKAKVAMSIEKFSSISLLIAQFYFIYHLGIVHFTLNSNDHQQRARRLKSFKLLFYVALSL